MLINGSELFVFIGNCEIFLEVINFYIDIFVMGVVCFNKFEISVGMSFGFLVVFWVLGEICFVGVLLQGDFIVFFLLVFDYNYFDEFFW